LKDILADFEGVVKPGEMLRESYYLPHKFSLFLTVAINLPVVLGSPGAGCSTLLKTMANHTSEYHSVSGSRHYDSITPADVAKHFRGDVQYCPEDDVHFPTLTVEQTIQFAARTRTPRDRADHSREQFQETLTTILTTVFGLRHARKTPVGDAAVRGVSGGEKKRVSIAEALATRACITCWDK
jgi:ATP-binding cassette subfamily G (WHITE) protein 2 (SNQ2)